MISNVAKPIEIGIFRRLLLRIRADERWPVLRAWLVGDPHPEDELFGRVIHSIGTEPDKWTPNPYGLTNKEDQIGVYVAEGVERVVIAADRDKQFRPSPWAAYFLHQLWLIHRDYMAAKEAAAISSRL